MVCLNASVLLLTALQTPQLLVAVTEGGVHIQSIEAEVGDRQVETPYGLYRTPHDPVVRVVDRAQQIHDLRKLHQDGVLDDETWLQDLSTAGQLEELSRACLETLAQDPQAVLPYSVLESWGRRLDPVPADTPRDRRIAWLWKQSQGRDFTKAVLGGARLAEEVSFSSQAANERIVLLADLRKALRSNSVVRRRIAAHIAGKQQEFSLRETLMEASLLDPVEASRDAAAEGVHSIHAHSARQYWVRNLARGKNPHREAAAWNLGRYGGADGLHGLIHVLAAWNHKTGDRFDFSERTIWVVSDRDRSALDVTGFDPLEGEVDALHLAPDLEFLDLGSKFKVLRYGESLQLVLLAALDHWADTRTERDTDAWLKFYLEDWLPSRP